MLAQSLGAVLVMVQSGSRGRREKLISKRIRVEHSIDALMNMDKFEVAGVTVVTEF